ncbi:MAG: hypothetical protein N2315_05560 [Thermanaerothrix sp.]|nr:hypothetical protein [Thermanaerothrix sp.]
MTVLVGVLCFVVLKSDGRPCLSAPLGLWVGIWGVVIRAGLQPVLGDSMGIEVFSVIPVWSILGPIAKLGYIMSFGGSMLILGVCLSCKGKINPVNGLCCWAIGITVSNVFAGTLGPQFSTFAGVAFGGYWLAAMRAILVTGMPSVILEGVSWKMLGHVAVALCSMGSVMVIFF